MANENILNFKLLPTISNNVFPTVLITQFFSLSNFLMTYNSDILCKCKYSLDWFDISHSIVYLYLVLNGVSREGHWFFQFILAPISFFFFNTILVMILIEIINVISGLKIIPRTVEIKSHKDINNMVRKIFQNKIIHKQVSRHASSMRYNYEWMHP